MAADFDKKRDKKRTGGWPRNKPEPRVQAKAKTDSSSVTPLFLQASFASPTAPINGVAIAEPAQTPAAAEPATEAADVNNAAGGILIVEDSVQDLEPGQMRRSEFLALLRAEVISAAEEALSGTIWSSLGCPWIDRWFNYYGERNGSQIERAIHKYAPETSGITTAGGLVPAICGRVRDAISVWTTTGEMPEEAPTDLPMAGAGEEGARSQPGNIFTKEWEGVSGDTNAPEDIQGNLGSGSPLDTNVRSDLESAYGEDFSRVRVHTGASAASVSNSLNARAFTVGSDIAFAANEYKPGTPIGDALIAHELAHVKQQRIGAASEMPAQKAAAEHGGLEDDADQAAVGAVVSIWSGAGKGLANVTKSTMPALRSGLRLQRCGGETEQQKKGGKLLEDFAAKFPDAAALIGKSEAAVKLVNDAEAAGARFGGYSEEGPDKDVWPYTKNGRVYVPKAHTDKVTAMRDFLFELNNAMRTPTYFKLAMEARKGSGGTLTAKEFARQYVEQEVEGMLVLGETWVEMKKGFGGGTEFDKYDKDFFLVEYNDYKEGRKTKDDIVNATLNVVYSEGAEAGKTVEQHYIEEYNKKSGGK